MPARVTRGTNYDHWDETLEAEVPILGDFILGMPKSLCAMWQAVIG